MNHASLTCNGCFALFDAFGTVESLSSHLCPYCHGELVEVRPARPDTESSEPGLHAVTGPFCQIPWETDDSGGELTKGTR